MWCVTTVRSGNFHAKSNLPGAFLVFSLLPGVPRTKYSHQSDITSGGVDKTFACDCYINLISSPLTCLPKHNHFWWVRRGYHCHNGLLLWQHEAMTGILPQVAHSYNWFTELTFETSFFNAKRVEKCKRLSWWYCHWLNIETVRWLILSATVL